MNQNLIHTTPPPSSQAAAYGYKHAGGMASQGMAWGHTLTESGNMACGGSVSVSWYSGSSKSGYSFPMEKSIGIGARYLDPELSLWLSVDPLADKYPSMRPFMYTAGNPVMLVDPDGRKFDPAMEKHIAAYEKEINMRIEFLEKKMDAIDIDSKEYKSLLNQKEEYSNILNEISDLRNDDKNLYCLKYGQSLEKGINGEVTYGGKKNGMNIINVNLKAKKGSNPALSLSTFAHEMKHAYQYFQGLLGFAIDKNGNDVTTSDSKPLEREAGVRGDMFSGPTMLNNGKFKIYRNINPDKYKLSPFYDKYSDIVGNQQKWTYLWKRMGLTAIFNQK